MRSSSLACSACSLNTFMIEDLMPSRSQPAASRLEKISGWLDILRDMMTNRMCSGFTAPLKPVLLDSSAAFENILLTSIRRFWNALSASILTAASSRSYVPSTPRRSITTERSGTFSSRISFAGVSVTHNAAKRIVSLISDVRLSSAMTLATASTFAVSSVILISISPFQYLSYPLCPELL